MASNLAVAVMNGIVWGLIMALIALGLNLIFGLLHIINMAHGALYMLGAVLAAFSGVLAAPIVSVDFMMGREILIMAFIIVIVGGMSAESVAIYPERRAGAVEYHRVYIFNFFARKETHPGSVANGRAVFVDGETGRILKTLPLFKPLGCCLPGDWKPEDLKH